MPLERKYIIAKGTGGLGNRILALTTAILYAKISERQLVIDWSDGHYAPLGVNAFPLFFDCPHSRGLDALREIESVYPEVWRGHLGEPSHRMKGLSKIEGIHPLSIDVAKLDYDQDVVVFCAYHQELYRMRHLFRGEFSNLLSMSKLDLLTKMINEEISLRQDIMKDVDSVVSERFEPGNIGVHIRHTDIQISLDKIYRAVEKAIVRSKARAQIFLATDSLDVERGFRSRFDNVFTTDKWFPPSGGKLHQNLQECPDLVQNGIEALTDLHLLSRCGSVVYSSRSTFGLVASLLSSNRKCHDVDRLTVAQKIRRRIRHAYGRHF